MYYTNAPERLTEALARANQHWQTRSHAEPGSPTPSAFTIALSREAGTFGAAIAREVGSRLGWPVYDSELLQHIADDMGVRRALLETVDERQVGWLSECLEGLSSTPSVSQPGFVRHLVETLLSLALRGECVIVGRGASHVLPIETTLRVRVVAPLEYRIKAVMQEHAISHKEAARKVANTDRDRSRFVTEHFRTSPEDITNYDLILNAARFTPVECADLIIAALNRLGHHRATSLGRQPAGALLAV